MPGKAQPDASRRALFLALLEDYRQAVQDRIYVDHQYGWPETQEAEAKALHQLHACCARWVERYEAAPAGEE